MTDPLFAAWASDNQPAHLPPPEAYRLVARRLYASGADITMGLVIGWAWVANDLFTEMRHLNPGGVPYLRVDEDHGVAKITARFDRSTREQKAQLADFVEAAISELEHTCVYCGDTTTARPRTAAEGAETVCCDGCLPMLRAALKRAS